MEDIKYRNYYDERLCAGIDCAWCLDFTCILSAPFKSGDENNDLVRGQEIND